MVKDRVLLYILVISIVAVIITFVVGKLANGKRIYKYIPFIISAITGIGLYIKALYFSKGFEGIGFLLLAIAAGIFTITSLAAAVLTELFLYKSRFIKLLKSSVIEEEKSENAKNKNWRKDAE